MPRNQIALGCVSRAVRRPTRFDDDIRVSGPGGIVLAVGSDDFRPESLVAGEIGYRVQPTPRCRSTRRVFTHRIERSAQPGTAADGPAGCRRQHARRRRPRRRARRQSCSRSTWWRTHVGYTWLDTEIRRAAGSRDVGGGVDRGERSATTSSASAARSISRTGSSSTRCCARWRPCRIRWCPSYAELNLRVGWWVTSRVELWVAGQDLLHDRHPEFGPNLPTRVEFERSIRVGITIRTAR